MSRIKHAPSLGLDKLIGTIFDTAVSVVSTKAAPVDSNSTCCCRECIFFSLGLPQNFFNGKQKSAWKILAIFLCL